MKPSRKEMGYRVFPDVNRIGRLKAMTFIPILLGHYRQLHKEITVFRYIHDIHTNKILFNAI